MVRTGLLQAISVCLSSQKLLMQTYFPSFEKFPLKRSYRPDWFISIRQHPAQQVDGMICNQSKTAPTKDQPGRRRWSGFGAFWPRLAYVMEIGFAFLVRFGQHWGGKAK